MANPKKLIEIITGAEGGYVNHPNDRGKETNAGVTIAMFRFLFGKEKTVQDLKNMTPEQWRVVFDWHWNKWHADEINNESIANLLVDWFWGSGVWGIKHPQRVLGVKADGIVGKKTLAAINKHPNPDMLFKALWEARKRHFESIVTKNPTQKVFLRGWLNRLNKFTYYV